MAKIARAGSGAQPLCQLRSSSTLINLALGWAGLQQCFQTSIWRNIVRKQSEVTYEAAKTIDAT